MTMTIVFQTIYIRTPCPAMLSSEVRRAWMALTTDVQSLHESAVAKASRTEENKITFIRRI